MEGITCNCSRFVTFKPCQSDRNGNKGRLVAVCNGPNAQGESCGTVQWKNGSSTSPSSSPTINTFLPLFPGASQPSRPTEALPTWSQTMGDSFFAMNVPVGTRRCAKHGCGQSRLADDCQRRMCRKHCRELQGCTSKTHAPPTVSGSPLTTQSSRSHIPSLPVALPSMTTVDTISQGSPSPAIPWITSLSPSPLTQALPDLRSLNAHPDPRFRSQMPAIFTDQWKCEQEMEAERKRAEAEKKVHATQVKHTVTVYAWSEDSKHAMVQDFQEGPFKWAYFPLSSSVLSALSLTKLETRVQLYRKALGTWVTISTGHVIEVEEGARIFLKGSHVIDCINFDKLLNPPSTSTPHIRNNLPGERRELRERYKKALERENIVDAIWSDDEDAGNRTEQPATNPASIPQSSASPPAFFNINNTVIDLSSDHSPLRTLQKRKLSDQATLSTPKRRNIVRRHENSVIELSDDSDCSSPSAHAASTIKLEQDEADLCKKHWPADFYCVDIIKFFGACQDTPDIRRETLFHRHFPNIPYHRSTVNENRVRWLKAIQSIRDAVLKAKRSDEGKWSVFQRKSRKK